MFAVLKIIPFALLFFIVRHSECQFLPSRLAIIDSNGANYLVRGNLPIHHNQFQMRQLNGNLSALTNLTNFNLLVFSLMNYFTPKETRNRYIEEKYFEKHLSDNEYRARPILGSFLSPFSLQDGFLRKGYYFLQSLFGYDKIDEMLHELRMLLVTSQKSTIIYVHCSAGVDRTGYVSAAYQMKYQHVEFSEAVRQNVRILQDLDRNKMHFNTFNGLQWFCLRLRNWQQKRCKVKLDSK